MEETKQEKDADMSNSDKQACTEVCVCMGVCGCTHFLTFLTFMLAVLLLQERMRGSALSSGISALLA